ncbi:MAG: hypothetical protein ACI4VM_00645, partial [Anaerovoracaceae bacterium]
DKHSGRWENRRSELFFKELMADFLKWKGDFHVTKANLCFSYNNFNKFLINSAFKITAEFSLIFLLVVI